MKCPSAADLRAILRSRRFRIDGYELDVHEHTLLDEVGIVASTDLRGMPLGRRSCPRWKCVRTSITADEMRRACSWRAEGEHGFLDLLTEKVAYLRALLGYPKLRFRIGRKLAA